jgi:hypothetical protein
VVSLDPERGVILMIPLPVKPYSAEKLLVNTVTSFTNPEGIANFVLLENVRYYLIHQLNKKYIKNLLHWYSHLVTQERSLWPVIHWQTKQNSSDISTSTGISWISAAFSSKETSASWRLILQLRLCDHNFVQFVWFFGTKTKVTFDAWFERTLNKPDFDRQMVPSKQLGIHQEQEFHEKWLSLIVWNLLYCYANYWLIKSPDSELVLCVKIDESDRYSWATANVVALSKKQEKLFH